MPGNRKGRNTVTQKEKTVAKLYEPTPSECELLQEYLADRKENPRAPRVTVSTKQGVAQLGPDHPEPAVGNVLLMEALGTGDMDYLNGILRQLANAGSRSQEVDESVLNFMLSAVIGINPQDEIETMLATQMAVIHMATMSFARRLASAENLSQQDSAERAFNKLARTFAAQIEALKRYRTGGEQKIVVQHVTVEDGGQAIVGNVETGERGATKNGGTTS